MSYKINKTDGALLVDLIDGRADNASTDLTLFGRNYTGYGEAFNENFVKVLENFASTAAPSSPLVGQLWYDTSEVTLKVYNGQSFVSTSATIVSSTPPASLAAGGLWVDTATKQLKFSDGSNTFLAGPIYTVAQGQSGLDVKTLLDEFGNSKVVVQFLISAQPVAIISRETFNTATAIPNFNTEIKEGVNVSSLYPEFAFPGISGNDVFFSLDTTGLSNSSIETIIESMVSSTTKNNNVEALIHCTAYSGTNTYNAADGISKTFVTVDKAGTENQSVLADISFSDTSGTVALTVSRTLKRFRVVTGSWTYIEDVT